MTYIINPWFFYFVNLLGSFWTLISIVLFLAIIGTVGFSVWWLMETYNSDFFVHDDDNEHDNNEHDDNESPFAKFCKKIIKVSVIVTIISAVLMVAVPSEETVNKMMISSFITKENIEKAKEGAKEGVKEGAKEIVDYIAEKAIELKKAE